MSGLSSSVHCEYCSSLRCSTSIPLELRAKWLKKLRHHKVRHAVSSFSGGEGSVAAKAKKLRPFIVDRKELMRRRAAEESEGLDEQAGDRHVVTCSAGEPLKPSELIAAAVAAGELSAEDVAPTATQDGAHSAAAPAVSVDAVEVTLSGDVGGTTLLLVQCSRQSLTYLMVSM